MWPNYCRFCCLRDGSCGTFIQPSKLVRSDGALSGDLDGNWSGRLHLRNTKTLDLNREIETLFGWILTLVALTVIPMIFIDVYQGKFQCEQSSRDCTQLSPPLEVFLDCLASLEGIATVIWLLRRGRRAKATETAAGTK